MHLWTAVLAKEPNARLHWSTCTMCVSHCTPCAMHVCHSLLVEVLRFACIEHHARCSIAVEHTQRTYEKVAVVFVAIEKLFTHCCQRLPPTC